MIESTGNLLPHLRTGTEAEHRRVEQHPLVAPLVASTLTREEYSLAIAAFTGFYAALEPLIEDRASRVDFSGYRYQARLPLLLEDRAALPDCVVTPCSAAPGYSREDELVGALYVLEGATQGGRVIAPRLRHRLGFGDSAGARYFNFYRQRTWEKFRTMVVSRQQHYDYQLVVASAQATFDHLHTHLDLCLFRIGVMQ